MKSLFLWYAVIAIYTWPAMLFAVFLFRSRAAFFKKHSDDWQKLCVESNRVAQEFSDRIDKLQMDKLNEGEQWKDKP